MLHIALAVSPLLLLLPHAYLELSGKETLILMWRAMDLATCLPTIHQAEHAIWEVLFTTATGGEVLPALETALLDLGDVIDEDTPVWLHVIGAPATEEGKADSQSSTLCSRPSSVAPNGQMAPFGLSTSSTICFNVEQFVSEPLEQSPAQSQPSAISHAADENSQAFSELTPCPLSSLHPLSPQRRSSTTAPASSPAASMPEPEPCIDPCMLVLHSSPSPSSPLSSCPPSPPAPKEPLINNCVQTNANPGPFRQSHNRDSLPPEEPSFDGIDVINQPASRLPEPQINPSNSATEDQDVEMEDNTDTGDIGMASQAKEFKDTIVEPPIVPLDSAMEEEDVEMEDKAGMGDMGMGTQAVDVGPASEPPGDEDDIAVFEKWLTKSALAERAQPDYKDYGPAGPSCKRRRRNKNVQVLVVTDTQEAAPGNKLDFQRSSTLENCKDLVWFYQMDAATILGSIFPSFIKVLDYRLYIELDPAVILEYLHTHSCLIIVNKPIIDQGFTKKALLKILSLDQLLPLQDVTNDGIATLLDLYRYAFGASRKALSSYFIPTLLDVHIAKLEVDEMHSSRVSTGSWREHWCVKPNGKGHFICVETGLQFLYIGTPQNGDFCSMHHLDLNIGGYVEDQVNTHLWNVNMIPLISGTTVVMRPNLPYAFVNPEPTIMSEGDFICNMTLEDTIVDLDPTLIPDTSTWDSVLALVFLCI
ncbi:hypothetical protein DXG01_012395 [Tephrocybe rancida]|nr:hypothetical protein DXG01_012395 [Tephrocybe rancida]